MNADQWSRVKEIFHAALERTAAERTSFVVESCGGDAVLRAEVERLLSAHDQAGTFIEQAPIQTPTMTGRLVGRHQIGRLLGAGGMGEVYAARDVDLGREVALKIATGADGDAQARLRREARHASHLNHPHICTIYEVGSSDGLSYIVMEYIEGRRLSDIIPPGPPSAFALRASAGQAAQRSGAVGGLPLDAILRYGIQIAGALAHAHRNGVIHGDLKSANTIITPDERAKVLDFGLARRLPVERLKDLSQSQDSLTPEGAVSGTLSCMAPELLRGEQPDARSDIWALGVLLYEMAAGARPFTGATGFELSAAILHNPPAPLPARLPPSLKEIIKRCLAKDQRERYRQAEEIGSALEGVQAQRVVRPRVVSMFPRSRRGAIAMLGLVLLLSLVGTWAWRSARAGVRNVNGYALLDDGRFADAIREFETYARLRPWEPNPYDSLGEAYLMMGDPKKAIESYSRALSIDPAFVIAHNGRAWSLASLGRYDEAIAEDPPRQAFKALILSRVGRYREADQTIAAAIAEATTDEPGDAAALSLLSATLAIERTDNARALHETQSAARIVASLPSDEKSGYLVAADLFGGTAEVRLGRIDEARSRFESQTLRYTPATPSEKWWHGALEGEIALATGDLQKAGAAFAAAEPSRKWVIISDRGSDSDLLANTVLFRDGLARVAIARGDLRGAIQIYRQLLNDGPEQKWVAVFEPRYVLEIARLLEKSGDRAGAAQEYQHFLDLWKNADPGLPELAEAKRGVR